MLSKLATEISLGLGAAAGLGLVAGGYAYAAMWPTSRIFGRTLIAPRRPEELALTFDDGPNPIWTPRLLEILAHHDVRVTFFMVGSHARREPDLVRRVAAEGHLIGNHSWSHLNLAKVKASLVREELRRGQETLQDITGQPVRFFRPPFGARRPYVLHTARDMGMIPVHWNAMTTDWSDPTADEVVMKLTKKIDRLVRKGKASNIVLHDGSHLESAANRQPSVTAAGQLIAHYKVSRRFVTLDAWEKCTSA
jgi:peptidoglycan-N-acetylglucosamine deacetylase